MKKTLIVLAAVCSAAHLNQAQAQVLIEDIENKGGVANPHSEGASPRSLANREQGAQPEARKSESALSERKQFLDWAVRAMVYAALLRDPGGNEKVLDLAIRPPMYDGLPTLTPGQVASPALVDMSALLKTSQLSLAREFKPAYDALISAKADFTENEDILSKLKIKIQGCMPAQKGKSDASFPPLGACL